MPFFKTTCSSFISISHNHWSLNNSKSNIKRFICQSQKLYLRLTVSRSRAEHFIRIDLVDSISVSHDRHKVAPSKMLMTSKVDHKMWQIVGPLVSVHSVWSALFLIQIASRIRRDLWLHSLQRTLSSCQFITSLFWTAWSATTDIDCSLSDYILDCRVKLILEASTFSVSFLCLFNLV